MSILDKQKYLHAHVIGEGYDPEEFADYISEFKDDGKIEFNELATLISGN